MERITLQNYSPKCTTLIKSGQPHSHHIKTRAQKVEQMCQFRCNDANSEIILKRSIVSLTLVRNRCPVCLLSQLSRCFRDISRSQISFLKVIDIQTRLELDNFSNRGHLQMEDYPLTALQIEDCKVGDMSTCI